MSGGTPGLGFFQRCTIEHAPEECPERSRVVQFTRYEHLANPVGFGYCDPAYPTTREELVEQQHAAGRAHNDLIDAMRYMLYQQATKPWPFPPYTSVPLPRWKRLWYRVQGWFDRWMPRVHFGPCDHSDCDNY